MMVKKSVDNFASVPIVDQHVKIILIFDSFE